MRLHGKSKGFTLIELLVVIGVMGVILTIAIASSGEQRQKAQLEETAGAIRDYLIEAGAVSSKINTPVFVRVENGDTMRAYRANVTVNNAGTTITPVAILTNWEGGTGKNKIVNLVKVDSVNICGYTGNNLFSAPADNGSVTISNGDATTSADAFVLIRPMGPAYYVAGNNFHYARLSDLKDSKDNYRKAYFVVRKGKYASILEVAGAHTVNMYTAHLSDGQDPLKAGVQYYTAK